MQAARSPSVRISPSFSWLKENAHPKFGWVHILFNGRKHFLSHITKGAQKILGQIIKGCTGGNAKLGRALFLVIFPSANVTNIFHMECSFLFYLLYPNFTQNTHPKFGWVNILEF
jgi:hypothetical protein